MDGSDGDDAPGRAAARHSQPDRGAQTPGDDASDATHGGGDAHRNPDGAAVSGSSRRRFLQGAGLGAVALLGGGVAGRAAATTSGVAGSTDAGVAGAAGTHADHGLSAPGPRIYDAAAPGGTPSAWLGGEPGTAASAAYGHGVQPPLDMAATALDARTFPPTNAAAPRTLELDVVETSAMIAEGVVVDQWTYAGTAPGPTLRATEGELLRVTVTNRTAHDHNLHLHGRHSPQMDGWEPIPPGQSFTYEIEAGPVGVHPYHCHTPPLAQHIAMGLYGTMIVDPPTPREPAHEVVLMLSGWDVDGDGRNELYTYNGVGGFYTRHPITVPVGELVRVYVLNMVEYEALASFHLHAQTFDVHRTGTSPTPDEHTDTVTMSQGERAIVEFRLPERGRYMFHPHQHHMADAGAMGWFAAV